MPVDGTRLLRKHEGFSANPWCLWVSDISYIQTEDLEDPDEGEYHVSADAPLLYEGIVVARARDDDTSGSLGTRHPFLARRTPLSELPGSVPESRARVWARVIATLRGRTGISRASRSARSHATGFRG